MVRFFGFPEQRGAQTDHSDAEEFAIYLNYVRKLGFEETPDYDFLRELFSKVLKNRGEVDDGVFDWMQLNNGRGWEAGVSEGAGRMSNRVIADTLVLQSSTMLSSSGHESRGHRGGRERDRERERERAERHAQRAAAAAAAAAAAQSGSASGAATPTQAAREAKIGRQPSASATPQPGASVAAVKGVQAPTPAAQGGKMNRMSSTGHPYASAGAGGSGAFEGEQEYGSGSNGYRTSAGAMQPSAGGAAATGLGGQNGAAGAQEYHDDDHHRGGFSLMKFLTCRCG